jgi:hypothetical protein
MDERFVMSVVRRSLGLGRAVNMFHFNYFMRTHDEIHWCDSYGNLKRNRGGE